MTTATPREKQKLKNRMLLKSFYTIIKLESLKAHALEATIEIQKEHPIFEGHFPDFPVTPGVAMLQIIKELTEKYHKQLLLLESASNIKFLSLVNPNVNATLKFNIIFQEDAQHIKLKNTTSFEDGTPVLKCNVTFAKR